MNKPQKRYIIAELQVSNVQLILKQLDKNINVLAGCDPEYALQLSEAREELRGQLVLDGPRRDI